MNSVIIFLIIISLSILYSIPSRLLMIHICSMVWYYSDICSEIPFHFYIENKRISIILYLIYMILFYWFRHVRWYWKVKFYPSLLISVMIRLISMIWNFLLIKIYIWIFKMTMKRNDLSWSSIKMISRLFSIFSFFYCCNLKILVPRNIRF